MPVSTRTRGATRSASREVEEPHTAGKANGAKTPRKAASTKSSASPERTRRKLRNTKIEEEAETEVKPTETSEEDKSSEPEPAETDQASPSSDKSERTSKRGRVKKKRSFDELDAEESEASKTKTGSKQPRKRSRSDEGKRKDEETPTDEPSVEAAEVKDPSSLPEAGVATESTDPDELPGDPDPATIKATGAFLSPNATNEKRFTEAPLKEAVATKASDVPSLPAGEPSSTESPAEPALESATHVSNVLPATEEHEATPATPPLAAVEETSKAAQPSPTKLPSPQNKRNRDAFVNGQQSDAAAPARAALSTDNAAFDKESTPSVREPEKKKPREDAPATEQAPVTAASVTKIEPGSLPAASAKPSGFANTSSAPPFAALPPKTASKSAEPSSQPQTSASAFAASGFASFAAASQSPFGAVSGTASPWVAASGTASPWGAAASAPATEKPKQASSEDQTADAPAPSGFAALNGTKSSFGGGFGATTNGSSSGFGSLGGGGGFGAVGGGFGAVGGKSPLTSWGSGPSAGIIGSSSKPAKPFGAPADEDEEDEGSATEADEENLIGFQPADESRSTDPRFHQQKVETGEEGERNVYTSRAKLYMIHEEEVSGKIVKQWKERAVGSIKINIKYDEESKKRTARFIMRADGTHRIMLNSPITEGVNMKDPAGGPPQGKNALFIGFEDGKTRLMQLKMKNDAVMAELYHKVLDVLEDAA